MIGCSGDKRRGISTNGKKTYAIKEKGFIKIALFAKDNIPTHAARQLPNGLWTSKLGILEDVRHSLSAISGGIYGSVVVVMKRKSQ